MTYITVDIPEALLRAMEEYVGRDKKYATKVEYIRVAIRNQLKKDKRERSVFKIERKSG